MTPSKHFFGDFVADLAAITPVEEAWADRIRLY
jgi:hypothetical protein